jgi:hypothetical protein
MDPDPLSDPRGETLQPTPEEVEAWAARETKRREAWLAGPGQAERDDWARRYRRRAALGLAESRLGPSPDEVETWATSERARRQAWLAGPGEDEQRDWARRQRQPASGGAPEAELSPGAEEIDAWAARERQRRQAWVAGPTAEEKQRWARRETGGWWTAILNAPLAEGDVADTADRWFREADLAAKGSIAVLLRAPLAIWSHLVRSGRELEGELYQPAAKRRVRF